MILFDTKSTSFRYVVALISGVERADEPVKVVIDDGMVHFSLKCGLNIKTPIWDGEYNHSDFVNGDVFYFNAAFLGQVLNSCVGSEQVAFLRQGEKVHVAAYFNAMCVDGAESAWNGDCDGEPMFSYEAELVEVESFNEASFGDTTSSFELEQGDLVDLFGLSDYFSDVDICRKSGVVSFRVGDDSLSVVTRYTASNVGKSKNEPDFSFNVSKDTMKLLSFVGSGSVKVEYDGENQAIKASDGVVTVIANVSHRKYDSLVFKDGDTKFIVAGPEFDGAIPKLCESIASTGLDDEFSFEYVGPHTVGITWRGRYGEIFKSMSVGEAKKFEPFSIRCHLLGIVLGSIHDSSVVFAETADGKRVALCSNGRYRRKVIF